MWAALIPAAASIIGGMMSQDSGSGAKASMEGYAQEYNPYINRGNDASSFLMDQSNQLMTNPNFLQDMISKGFTQSPYQQQMIGDTTAQMNMNAANTGMIQSPAAQRALNDRIGTMSGQFLNDYINRGMQSYNTGFNQYNNFANQGLQALQGKSGLLTGGTQAETGANTNFISSLMNSAGGIASLFNKK